MFDFTHNQILETVNKINMARWIIVARMDGWVSKNPKIGNLPIGMSNSSVNNDNGLYKASHHQSRY